jgi:hypothetical protein
MQVIQFAEEILDLAADRDYWKRQALHYKGMCEMYQQSASNSLREYEQQFAGMLTAALDPDSGINRAARAIEHDPLRGAVEEEKA